MDDMDDMDDMDGQFISETGPDKMLSPQTRFDEVDGKYFKRRG